MVEDHADTREVLRQMLEHAGARALLAEHGHAALDLLEHAHERPHIILCDLLMPELDGLALARHLEADLRWQKIPVLAVTALGAAADYINTWAHGFAGHLVKPVDPDTLIYAVRRLTRKTGRWQKRSP
ncbi:MAG TPA: response regulator [Methylomirabilota bacterium]|nr:response regulator [Methylomirabilota bacterium]